MGPHDLIFWYTGWAIWGIIGICTTIVAFVAAAFACAKAYHATLTFWWHWVVLARLRDVYTLKPEMLRNALRKVGENEEDAQQFMRTARDVTNSINLAKSIHEGTHSFSGIHCKWWKGTSNEEARYTWLTLCGAEYPTATHDPFKDYLHYCPQCGKGIMQCSSAPSGEEIEVVVRGRSGGPA